MKGEYKSVWRGRDSYLRPDSEYEWSSADSYT